MAEKASAGQRMATPLGKRRFRVHLDVEAVGRHSENIARFLGTGKYLLAQTVLVIIWILLNIYALQLQWDPYPFILLNLAFSTQAAYAAPLILLAQNRQENRDRVSLEEDRLRAAQTKADTEFLARELASLRIAVGEVATRDYVRHELEDLLEELRAELRAARETALVPPTPATDNGSKPGKQRKAQQNQKVPKAQRPS